MTKTSLILTLLSYSMVLIFATGSQQLQYARGITNSTSTVCINGKCTTTMCIDNESCRTLASNSTTIPDNSTENKDNNTLPSLGPLITV
jgi:hypothetical protein